MREYREERCGKATIGVKTVNSGDPLRRGCDLPAEPAHEPGPVSAVVVDDDPDIRELLRNHLELSRRVAVVGLASNGLEAITVTEQHQPDVVLLDLGLPKLSGIDAIPQLREVSPTTKIVAISGFVEGRLAKAAHDAGVDAYVEKGLSMRLVEVIERVVAGDSPDGD